MVSKGAASLETMPFKDPKAPGNIERMRAYRRKHYSTNKQAYIVRAKANKAALAEEVRQLKESQACTDCGQYFPYYVMQFDHLGDKVDLIKIFVERNNRAALMAEIAKCELVCANCHCQRTHDRLLSEKPQQPARLTLFEL